MKDYKKILKKYKDMIYKWEFDDDDETTKLFEEFTKEHFKYIFPYDYEKNFAYDLKKNYSNYLQCEMYMNE